MSSVPHTSPDAQFLDAGEVSPGTFVSMVDLGFGWRRETLMHFDRVLTDNLEQSGPRGTERLNFEGDYAGDLADIVSGRIPGRRSPEERTALVFAGTGLVDAAAAAVVFEKAVERGLGTLLAL